MTNTLLSTIIVLGIALLLLAALLFFYFKNKKEDISSEDLVSILPQKLVEESNLNSKNAELYNSLESEKYNQ